MIGVGFIGVGNMGRHQAQAFAHVSGCKVVAGADVSDGSREQFAAAFPDALCASDYRELVRRSDVDALVVSVPTGLHHKVVAGALKERKPVLVEKPMARTVAECQRLNELAMKNRTVLMVAQCRRFDPYWKSWGEAVRKGRIGFPVLWRHVAAGKGPGRWFMDDKLGGGPLMDGAVHNYDFANWVFGDPEHVVASSIKLVPSVSAIDTGTAVVRYASGDQLMLSWSWGAQGTHLHDIIGPKGFIQFGSGSHTPSAAEREKHNFCCLTNAKGQEALIKSRREPSMYVAQAKHFLDCIRGKATCLSPGTEAIKAVAVAEAILKAGPGGKARQVRW